ncbi:hypothetical protein [Nocardioides sp.]|uniref:hypothetical protein n=1 Tax=Nocardioides sp. TaxID=35761 RepID=UPI002B26839C|nr:hypothetical protein [Nocardioides sp.]
MAPRVELVASGRREPDQVSSSAPASVPVPVVVELSLAELLVLSEQSGGARLPLDLASFLEPDSDDGEDLLEQRLDGATPSPRQRARTQLRAAVDEARERPEPSTARLVEAGLLDHAGTPTRGVVSALSLLAAPEALLVLDLAVTRGRGEDRLRSWFAVAGSHVAQLSTASGLVVELSWYDVGGLPAALARAATVDEGPGAKDHGAGVGSPLRLPFELFSDGTEAVRRGRPDILAELVRLAPPATWVAGEEVAPERVGALVANLEEAVSGRLRVLVTTPEAEGDAGRRKAGVVSWLRLGGGWRSLVPLVREGVPLVEITAVTPRDLARSVGPVLAQVL